MDYWGGGGGAKGMLAPPSQIIWGAWPPLAPTKSVCVCGGGGGAVCGGGGRCWKQNCFLGGGDQGQQLKEV